VIRITDNLGERFRVDDLLDEYKAPENQNTREPNWNMTPKKSDSRCQGRTKSGKPCRAAATAGGLCFFHANPNKAAELGRIGGSKKGRVVQSSEPRPTVDNAIAVRDLAAQLIADVHAGKIHPKIAAGLAPLMNLQLRAIETSNLELQLAKLEERLARLESARDKKGTVQPTSSW
jgi:hypothetical protein